MGQVNYMSLRSAWLLLLVGCFMFLETESSINYSQPILPKKYSELIGQGFSTKYFTQNLDPPWSNYRKKNIHDVYNAGFRNLRLRCSTWLYPYPYESANFTKFLNKLEKVVDKCLEVGVTPIISWANKIARSYATEIHRTNYLNWWEKVAERLKDKDYRLSFNLFTEIGNSYCKPNCDESLKNNPDRYNDWTSEVVKRIRGSGGKNGERILILGSPAKGSEALYLIDKTIYENDTYMMVEHHVYASGPNQKLSSGKYWVGNGTTAQRQKLLDELEMARNSTTLLTYFGAWMPVDFKKQALDQYAVESFAKYFVSTLKKKGIPWSLNALSMYYTEKRSKWLTDTDKKKGIIMSRVLDVIKENM